MYDQVTLQRADAAGPEARGLAASLPFDLLEQVGGGMAPWTSENAHEWWTAHGSRVDA